MKKLYFIQALIVSLFILGSCGNPNTATTETVSDDCATETVAMSVDSLNLVAESIIGDTILVEGLCAHICSHGGTKIFLQAADSSLTRVQAGDFGAFERECINSTVAVTGVLAEERIDEAYLLDWEAKIAEKAAEEVATDEDAQGHESEAGCSSENKSRNVQGNTEEERIADFRAQIAEREQECGKAYLSFYYISAISYEIKK